MLPCVISGFCYICKYCAIVYSYWICDSFRHCAKVHDYATVRYCCYMLHHKHCAKVHDYATVRYCCYMLHHKHCADMCDSWILLISKYCSTVYNF